MRTAEEIYESNVEYERHDVSDMLKRSILGAIITAQKEAIEECAKKSKLIDRKYDPVSRDVISETEVDKQSILDLIDGLK